MNPAPLQLIDYWATSLRMDACPEYDSEKETGLHLDSITVESEVRKLDSPESERFGTKWIVGLSVEQEPCSEANIPYTFTVCLQGVVLVLPGGPEGEKLERVVKANGPAMLFGVAREMIRAVTGRGPNPAVIIPSTNFIDSSASKIPGKNMAKKLPATPKSKGDGKSPGKITRKKR